jgi:hypothetical protein
MNVNHLAVLATALIWACSSSTDTITSDNLTEGRSLADVVELGSSADLSTEVALLDVGHTKDARDSTLEFTGHDVTAPDLEPTCESGSGCFLDPCNSSDDCLSGLCVEHMGDTVCTITCVEECPEGWQCQQLGTGPDAMFACMSPFSHLCRPCKSAADCTSKGGQEQACIDYGDAGSFCGAPCAEVDQVAQCPWGFSCQQSQTVDGIDLAQCVNDAGSCPCTAAAVLLGLWTPCFVSNDWGTCPGKRVCLAEGLSDCDAAQPATEDCNGVDDDCDGEIDEPELVDGEYAKLCDDLNPCTEDSCPGEQGCVNEVQVAGSCDDQDPCTAADHCEDGTCLAEPVLCDDLNPCTDDMCTPTGGCDHVNNNVGCDDGDVCTLGDTCQNGLCQGQSAACDCQSDEDCLALEDNNLCNGVLACDKLQFPYTCVVKEETIVACPEPEGANGFCLQPHCEPESGQCSFVPANEDFLCTNGDKCLVSNRCQEGVCANGIPLNCNDGNLCTADSCQPDAGCVHTPNQVECNDGDVCTTQDQCADGQCQAGPALVCDDGNVCNGSEACNSQTGCFPGEPLVCDDGKACNGLELCLPDMGCQMGDPPACGDQNPCTDDSCDDATGCTYQFNSASCDDANLCTANDICDKGQCWPGTPVDCIDHNPCTDDGCNPADGCGYSFNLAPCTDDDVCTLEDQCFQGLCQSAQSLSCDDGNPCTDDGCDPDTACTHTANQAPCDDLNKCTTGDHCEDGKCKIAGPVLCDDDNLCTDDWCDPQEGCQHTSNGNLCDDTDACTLNDLCVDSVCLGDTPLPCDDDNPCTDDSCQPLVGCINLPNQQGCDNQDPCTKNDVCHEAVCTPGDVAVCDDQNDCTEDSCLTMEGCQFDALTDTPCDDGDLCTEDDVCNDGQCYPGNTADCDDSNACTDDVCAPATGCTNEPNQGPCDDGDPCTGQDTCANGVCVPGDGPGCDDGDPCTADTCQPDGTCVHESDLAQEGCSNWSFQPNVSCIRGYPPSMDENGVIWSLATTTSCSGSDAYNNDAIVGVNSITGSFVTQFTVASPNSQPIYRENRITMSTDWNWNSTCSGCQIAYNLPSGSQAWKGGQGPHARGGISMSADGTIYSAYGSILAIGWNGSTAWSTSGNGGLGGGSMILADGNVVGCGTGGSCRKVSPSGSSIWQTNVGCGGSSLASDSGARLVAACGTNGVKVLAADGSAVFTVSPATDVNSPLVWKNDDIIVGTGDGAVLLLSSADGSTLYTKQLCAEAVFRPWLVTADNWIWGTCGDGHAAGASLDGEATWTIDTGETPAWLTIAADGNLVLAVGNTVWRLALETSGLAESAWPTRDHDLTRSRNGQL